VSCGEADISVEGRGKLTEQGDGGLGAAFLDALDLVIGHACAMVSAGVPLVKVAQVLRHHSLQSTAIYARADLDRLRLLAARSQFDVRRWLTGVPG
jgi:hypothetical protein